MNHSHRLHETLEARGAGATPSETRPPRRRFGCSTVLCLTSIRSRCPLPQTAVNDTVRPDLLVASILSEVCDMRGIVCRSTSSGTVRAYRARKGPSHAESNLHQ